MDEAPTLDAVYEILSRKVDDPASDRIKQWFHDCHDNIQKKVDALLLVCSSFTVQPYSVVLCKEITAQWKSRFHLNQMSYSCHNFNGVKLQLLGFIDAKQVYWVSAYHIVDFIISLEDAYTGIIKYKMNPYLFYKLVQISYYFDEKRHERSVSERVAKYLDAQRMIIEPWRLVSVVANKSATEFIRLFNFVPIAQLNTIFTINHLPFHDIVADFFFTLDRQSPVTSDSVYINTDIMVKQCCSHRRFFWHDDDNKGDQQQQEPQLQQPRLQQPPPLMQERISFWQKTSRPPICTKLSNICSWKLK